MCLRPPCSNLSNVFSRQEEVNGDRLRWTIRDATSKNGHCNVTNEIVNFNSTVYIVRQQRTNNVGLIMFH